MDLICNSNALLIEPAKRSGPPFVTTKSFTGRSTL
jgi:hypothetical protein